MKTIENDYYYNEHDVNQVDKIYRKNKLKKKKRRLKVLLFSIVVIALGYYFSSDYSKVKSVKIEGVVDLDKEELLEKIPITTSDYHLFLRTKKIENEVKDIPLIGDCHITKDFTGHVVVEVTESQKIAYARIGKSVYLIDDQGRVVETKNKDVIKELKTCPQLLKFKDLKFLKKFAKEYIRIPELIKNQISDIVYAPASSDPSRLKFMMNNGKILYLRVEEMANQLQPDVFDYEAFMTAYSKYNVFRFEGKHVYMDEE